MEKVKNVLKLLSEKHPGQIWLLSRFLFCWFGVNLLMHAFILLAICVMPFAMLLMGSDWSGFLMWYFAPSLVFVICILCEICIFIYEEYIDIEDVEENESD